MADCRYEFVRAFVHNGVNYWGGPIDDVIASGPFDLIIALSDKDIPPIKADAPEAFKHFNASISLPDVVRIDWKNEVPILPVNCWEALALDLKENSQYFGDIAVCCFDGTSKTGVALSILRNILLEEKADPVQTLRDNYVKTAVHTNAQIDYISYITGIDVECTGSKEKK